MENLFHRAGNTAGRRTARTLWRRKRIACDCASGLVSVFHPPRLLSPPGEGRVFTVLSLAGFSYVQSPRLVNEMAREPRFCPDDSRPWQKAMRLQGAFCWTRGEDSSYGNRAIKQEPVRHPGTPCFGGIAGPGCKAAEAGCVRSFWPDREKENACRGHSAEKQPKQYDHYVVYILIVKFFLCALINFWRDHAQW